MIVAEDFLGKGTVDESCRKYLKDFDWKLTIATLHNPLAAHFGANTLYDFAEHGCINPLFIRKLPPGRLTESQIAVFKGLEYFSTATCARLSSVEPFAHSLTILYILRGSMIDDAGLSGATCLRKLDIRQSAVRSMAPFRTSLRELTLYRSEISNAEIINLELLIKLVIISCENITKLPEGLTRLRHLKLSRTNIENSEILRASNITSLELNDCPTITILPSIHRLTALTLIDTVPHNIGELEFPNLTELNMQVLVGTIGITTLPAVCGRLKILRLGNVGVASSEFSKLTETHFDEFNIAQCDGIVAFPPRMTHVRRLLLGMTRIPNADLIRLNGIEELELRRCDTITTLGNVAKSLKTLDLISSPIGDADMVNLEKVRTIVLTACPNITILGPNVKNIERLVLQRLENDSLILAGLDNLKKLTLNTCPNITTFGSCANSIIELRLTASPITSDEIASLKQVVKITAARCNNPIDRPSIPTLKYFKCHNNFNHITVSSDSE